jgi:hypothetical protein
MSETNEANRRQHPRWPVRLPLYVALAGELYHKTVGVESRDLSAGGLAFATRTALPNAARTTIMLGKLEGLPSTAHIEARVVYCRPHPDGDGFTVGVQFTHFVDVTAEELLARAKASGAPPLTPE